MGKLDEIVLSVFGDIRRFNGYGPLPIPHKLDEEIASIISCWISSSVSERSTVQGIISANESSVFKAYSYRMASYAVRIGSREVLLYGCIALAIDDWKIDDRENLMELSLLVQSALLLGYDPELIIRDCASYISESVYNEYRHFLERDDDSRSIEAMGYSESADADGFRYAWSPMI